MALTKPILYKVPAFDARKSQTFSFNAIGGDIVTKARLKISNNNTGEVVYNVVKDIARFEFVYDPTSTVINGVYYNATISTFNSAGKESVESDPIQFWCYTTPTIKFIDLFDGDVVGNSTNVFNFKYDQIEKEALNSWIMNIYIQDLEDVSQFKLLFTSGETYTKTDIVPFSSVQVVGGLEDSKSYYVEVIGKTINQTIVKSQQVHFSVKYTQPGISTPIKLRNDCINGYIEITSSIGIIEGKPTPTPPKYLPKGGPYTELDLTDQGSFVVWDEGLNVIGNFAGVIKCRDLVPYKNIFTFGDAMGNNIEIDWNYGYVDGDNTTQLKCYASLSVIDAKGKNKLIYTIRTDYEDIPDSAEQITINFGKKNNLYEIKLRIGVI